MLTLPLYVLAEKLNQPTDYAEIHQAITTLIDKQIRLELHAVEQLDNRWLRHHPQLSVLADEEGFWLSSDGMKMQPRWQDELHRLKNATRKNELLARACLYQPDLKVLDCTGGLGHDGLLLARLGASVTMLERQPLVWLMLSQQLKQALHDEKLTAIAARMSLRYTDAAEFLTQMVPHDYDVIYLDPMFHASEQQPHQLAKISKKPQVKKQMQILQQLFTTVYEYHLQSKADELKMDDYHGNALLNLARHKARRVVVKRARHAPFLDQQKPDVQWVGDACRFDGYIQV